MKVRWYHGAVVINTKLYAVAGCGQLNTIEVKPYFKSFIAKKKFLKNVAVDFVKKIF